MKYQIEGRYPEYKPEIPDKEKASEYYIYTTKFTSWLKSKL